MCPVLFLIVKGNWKESHKIAYCVNEWWLTSFNLVRCEIAHFILTTRHEVTAIVIYLFRWRKWTYRLNSFPTVPPFRCGRPRMNPSSVCVCVCDFVTDSKDWIAFSQTCVLNSQSQILLFWKQDLFTYLWLSEVVSVDSGVGSTLKTSFQLYNYLSGFFFF